MPSKETQAVYDHIRNIMRAAADGGDPVGGLRKSFDDYAKVSAECMQISGEVTNLTVAGVPCAWHSHPESDEDRQLMYLHGGSYMAGSPYSHGALASRLSKATGCCVLLIAYRLTPEHAFPAPLEDATTAFHWMRHNGSKGPSPARKTFIAGDSAGGGLTLATAMSLRDSDEPLPDAVIPISAWTDLAHTGETMISRAEVDPIAGGGAMQSLVDAYLQGNKPEDLPQATQAIDRMGEYVRAHS